MLGARFENNGARFRVWAPNADEALVVYDNHSDRTTAFALTRNGEYFDGFVPDVVVGTRYKYIVVESGREIPRIDPAARDTTHSGPGDRDNGGFVVNPTFHWPPRGRTRSTS